MVRSRWLRSVRLGTGAACVAALLAACSDAAPGTPQSATAGSPSGAGSAALGGTGTAGAPATTAGTTSNTAGSTNTSVGGAGSGSGGGPTAGSSGSGTAGAAGTSVSGGGGGGGSAGGGNNAALDAKCTPAFTLDLSDKGPNGQLFMDAVKNDAEGFVQDIGRTVCRILYRKPEEVRDANHITLHIADVDGVAAKWGDVGDIDVEISTGYLATVGKDRIADEVRGILLHEMTHMYQNDDKPEATSSYLPNMYEGIGDFVRIRAGHPPKGAAPNDKGGKWYDKTYTSQAHFWLYLDTKMPDFVYKLNLTMKHDDKPWSEASIQEIAGKSADALWTEYQGAACCQGNTTTCCK